MVDGRSPNLVMYSLDLGPGTRVVDPAELAARILSDPALGEAITLCERAAGAPSQMRMMVRQEGHRAVQDARIIDSNRRAIQYAMRRDKRINEGGVK